MRKGRPSAGQRVLLLISEFFSPGSLLEFLKNREGQDLRLPHLVDMAAQVHWGQQPYLSQSPFYDLPQTPVPSNP